MLDVTLPPPLYAALARRPLTLSQHLTPSALTRPQPALAGREFLAAQLGGAPAGWQLKPLGRGRLNSNVYCALQQNSRRKVLLKRTPSQDPVHGAAVQATALTAASTRLGAAGQTRVPQVLACDAESGWLALEWVEGRPAIESIKRGTDDEAREVSAACGTWLCAFAVCTGSAAVDTAARLADIDEARAGQPVPPSLAAPYARLRAYAAEIANCDVPTAWVHGDFKAANLLVSTSGMWGIDLGPARRSLAIIDMASFLNDLRLTVSADRGRRLEAAFLAGYASAVPAAALNWLRLQMLIERHLEHAANWPQRVRHALLRLRLARLAQEIATRL